MNKDKRIWYGLAAAGAITFLACANPSGVGNNSGASSPPPTTVPVEMTLAEFDAITNGMTYDEVSKIVGVAGEVTSEYAASNPQYSSKTYTYHGESYSSAIITFTAGKVSSKNQFGLK